MKTFLKILSLIGFLALSLKTHAAYAQQELRLIDLLNLKYIDAQTEQPSSYKFKILNFHFKTLNASLQCQTRELKSAVLRPVNLQTKEVIAYPLTVGYNPEYSSMIVFNKDYCSNNTSNYNSIGISHLPNLEYPNSIQIFYAVASEDESKRPQTRQEISKSTKRDTVYEIFNPPLKLDDIQTSILNCVIHENHFFEKVISWISDVQQTYQIRCSNRKGEWIVFQQLAP